MRDAVRSLSTVTLTAEQIDTIGHGRFLDLSADPVASAPELAALDQDGELVAILRARTGGLFGPKLNLVSCA